MSTETGWAHFYEFPPDGQTIRLGYPDRGAFTYSLHGEFIDRVKWADVELGKGNLMMVERLLKSALGRPSRLGSQVNGHFRVILY